MAKFDRWKFIELMFRFRDNEIDGRTFSRRFAKLWKADRDARWKLKEGWDRPYDQLLQMAFLSKEISKEEFSERWRELWGYRSERDRAFADSIDRVFTACDAFGDGRPDVPREVGELDDSQLRAIVTKELASVSAPEEMRS